MERIRPYFEPESSGRSDTLAKRQRTTPEAPPRSLFDLPSNITDIVLTHVAQQPGQLTKLSQASRQASGLVNDFVHHLVSAQGTRHTMRSLGGVPSFMQPRGGLSAMQQTAELQAQAYLVPMQQRSIADTLQRLQNSRDFDAAVNLADTCISRWPHQPTWELAKAEALTGQYKLRDAEDLYQRVVLKRPRWPTAHVGLARSLLSHEELDTAAINKILVHCRCASELGDATGEGHFLAGMARFTARDFLGAEHQFGRAIQADAAYLAVCNDIGRIVWTGLSVLREPFSQKINMSFVGYKDALSAILGRGYQSLGQGDHRKAEGLFKEAIDASFETSQDQIWKYICTNKREDATVGLGYAQLGSGQLAKAERTFRGKTQYNMFDRRNGLAESLWLQGNFAEAEAQYQKIVEDTHGMLRRGGNPRYSLFCGNTDPYLQLGQLQHRRGNHHTAVQFFNYVLKIQESHRAALGLVSALRAMGQRLNNERYQALAARMEEGDENTLPTWALRYWTREMPVHPGVSALSAQADP